MRYCNVRNHGRRARAVSVFAGLLAVVFAASPVVARCDGSVDLRDVDTIAWAVVPSFGDARYTELRRTGQASAKPSSLALHYGYMRPGKPPIVKEAETSDAVFRRATARLDSAHILRFEPSSGPQPIVRSDGTTMTIERLDGTETYLVLKRCGVTLQFQMWGNDDPRLTAIVHDLDALVATLPLAAVSSDGAPLSAPVFRFPL
jgi:hypothetical protein